MVLYYCPIGSSLFDRVHRHHGNEECEEMQKIYCYQSVCINGSAALANLTRQLPYSIVGIIEAADGFSLLVKVSCCKHGEISCEALQALGNLNLCVCAGLQHNIAAGWL